MANDPAGSICPSIAGFVSQPSRPDLRLGRVRHPKAPRGEPNFWVPLFDVSDACDTSSALATPDDRLLTADLAESPARDASQC